MTALPAADVLLLFEEGQRRTPLARMGMIAPLSLTAGELETRVLELLPPRLEGVASCPSCGERCEATVTTADILALPLGDSQSCLSICRQAGLPVLQMPTGDDIAAVMHREDAALALLERCYGGPVPEHLVDAVDAALAAADPRADVQLALACPACAHEWTLRFDAIAFLWNEVVSGAERVLAEVDVLARAYGWSESEILALSARRRAMYVERLES